MYEAFDRIALSEPSSLPRPERELLAFGSLRQEINSDGHYGYLITSWSDDAMVAREVLVGLGFTELLELLDAAIARLGTGGFPATLEEREAILLDDDVDFDDLDRRFYALEATGKLDKAMLELAARCSGR